MGVKLVLITVLISGLGGVPGFYISQEKVQPDVYEVKEDKTTHTLTITSPKHEKSPLREITYYHIVEKPYEQVTTLNNNERMTITTNNPSYNDNVLRDNGYFTLKKNQINTKNTIDDEYISIKADKNNIENITIKSNEGVINAVNVVTPDDVNNAYNEKDIASLKPKRPIGGERSKIIQANTTKSHNSYNKIFEIENTSNVVTKKNIVQSEVHIDNEISRKSETVYGKNSTQKLNDIRKKYSKTIQDNIARSDNSYNKIFEIENTNNLVTNNNIAQSELHTDHEISRTSETVYGKNFTQTLNDARKNYSKIIQDNTARSNKSYNKTFETENTNNVVTNKNIAQSDVYTDHEISRKSEKAHGNYSKQSLDDVMKKNSKIIQDNSSKSDNSYTKIFENENTNNLVHNKNIAQSELHTDNEISRKSERVYGKNSTQTFNDVRNNYSKIIQDNTAKSDNSYNKIFKHVNTTNIVTNKNIAQSEVHTDHEINRKSETVYGKNSTQTFNDERNNYSKIIQDNTAKSDKTYNKIFENENTTNKVTTKNIAQSEAHTDHEINRKSETVYGKNSTPTLTDVWNNYSKIIQENTARSDKSYNQIFEIENTSNVVTNNNIAQSDVYTDHEISIKNAKAYGNYSTQSLDGFMKNNGKIIQDNSIRSRNSYNKLFENENTTNVVTNKNIAQSEVYTDHEISRKSEKAYGNYSTQSLDDVMKNNGKLNHNDTARSDTSYNKIFENEHAPNIVTNKNIAQSEVHTDHEINRKSETVYGNNSRQTLNSGKKNNTLFTNNVSDYEYITEIIYRTDTDKIIDLIQRDVKITHGKIDNSDSNVNFSISNNDAVIHEDNIHENAKLFSENNVFYNKTDTYKIKNITEDFIIIVPDFLTENVDTTEINYVDENEHISDFEEKYQSNASDDFIVIVPDISFENKTSDESIKDTDKHMETNKSLNNISEGLDIVNTENNFKNIDTFESSRRNNSAYTIDTTEKKQNNITDNLIIIFAEYPPSDLDSMNLTEHTIESRHRASVIKNKPMNITEKTKDSILKNDKNEIKNKVTVNVSERNKKIKTENIEIIVNENDSEKSENIEINHMIDNDNEVDAADNKQNNKTKDFTIAVIDNSSEFINSLIEKNNTLDNQLQGSKTENKNYMRDKISFQNIRNNSSKSNNGFTRKDKSENNNYTKISDNVNILITDNENTLRDTRNKTAYKVLVHGKLKAYSAGGSFIENENSNDTGVQHKKLNSDLGNIVTTNEIIIKSKSKKTSNKNKSIDNLVIRFDNNDLSKISETVYGNNSIQTLDDVRKKYSKMIQDNTAKSDNSYNKIFENENTTNVFTSKNIAQSEVYTDHEISRKSEKAHGNYSTLSLDDDDDVDRGNMAKNTSKEFVSDFINSDKAVESELVLYVINNYENPFDGKEGVNINVRHFTNGHGYQYFYPYPDDQEIIEDPKNTASVNDLELPEIDIRNGNISTDTIKSDEIKESGFKKAATRMKRFIDAEKDVTGRINNPSGSSHRRKRTIRTMMSFHEEIAPEDLFKDVMDKMSERLKRSLKSDGDSYGMTLTGGRGVVWNDFNEEKVSFPVGFNSDNIEVIKNANEGLPKTQEEVNKNSYKEIISSELVPGSSIQVANADTDIPSFKEFSKLKTNSLEYNEPTVLNARTNEENYDRENNIEGTFDNEIAANVQQNLNLPIVSAKTDKSNEPATFGTYGMNLIGGRGKVWNDLENRKLSYTVGESTMDQHNSAANLSNDDNLINEKIESFKNFLNDKPSELGPKRDEQIQPVLPSTEKSITKKTTIKTRTTKEPSTKKPIVNQQTTKLPRVTKPKKVEPIKNEPKNEITKNIIPKSDKGIEESKELVKTYGMSISGDSGIVWNDLNGGRTVYHVGDDKNKVEGKQKSETKTDDEVINEKIKQFQDSLNGKSADGQAEIEKDNEKAVTEKPVVIEPLTEEPIISEPAPDDPKTNRPIVIGPTTVKNNDITTEAPYTEETDEPVKTYGMSLTGDKGLVWNDLNGNRVSYHVGQSSETSKEEQANASTESSEEKKDDADQLLDEIDTVLDEIDTVLEEMVEETKNPENNTEKEILNDILAIIKEVFANETTKLEEKINQLNNSQNNSNAQKDNVNDKDEDSKREIDVQKLVNNDEFRKWLNDWISLYTDDLMDRVDEHIKEEVAKQMEEYLTVKNNETMSLNSSSEEDDKPDIDGNKEDVTEDVSKKRKDCDNKKENKESPVKIEATSVYGNSVGNGNVTNIFIFNINKMSDLDNNTMKPLVNGTDGVFVFGNEQEPEKVENINNVELDGFKEKDDTTDKITETVTTIPDKESLIDGTTEGPNVAAETENESKEINDNKNTDEIETNLSKESEITENSNEDKETDNVSLEIITNPDQDEKSNEESDNDNINNVPGENEKENSRETEDLNDSKSDSSEDNKDENASMEKESLESNLEENKSESKESIEQENTINSSENKESNKITDEEENDRNSNEETEEEDTTSENLEENEIEDEVIASIESAENASSTLEEE